MRLWAYFMLILILGTALVGCGQEEEVVDLSGVKVVMVIADRFNYEEANSTLQYLIKAGAEVTIAGIDLGETKPYDHPTATLTVESVIKDIDATQYDALYVPGGYSADLLKTEYDVRMLVEAMDKQESILAAICMGPVVLGNAGILDQVRVTTGGGLETYKELTEQGALIVSIGVLRSGRIITGRGPGDLPLFNTTLAKAIVETR